ncbi:MAG: putative sulfate exporter family transporter [bacterium]
MSAVPESLPLAAREREKMLRTEDWWAVWLGLGIVLVTLAVFYAGGTLRPWAPTPAEWARVPDLFSDLSRNALSYLAVFLFFGIAFTLSIAVMGRSVKTYVPGFAILFLGSLAIFALSAWTVMERADLGAPILALLAGLVISNLRRIPEWLKASLLTEYYIKTGIVLLGATLPLTLIFDAGPIAFLQATLVSVTTWGTIYLAATRLFRLPSPFAAVLGAGGAVCGVSASIAVGGATKARKDQIAISIAIVSVWAIVMIFVLTFVTKSLVPEAISPGEAGAWVGTSEFADAAGFAVVAELAQEHGDAPIQAFTLMKVIGRDIWIGIWCFILSIVSVLFWEKSEGGGARRRVGADVIWERFPKFVLGFLAASVIMSAVAAAGPAGHAGVAKVRGTFKSKTQKQDYAADFSGYAAPAHLAGKLSQDEQAGVISFQGKMSLEELAALEAAATDEDQKWALRQLHAASDWFESVLSPKVIKPIKNLRSWAFVLCFLSIGLSTRFAELATFGMKPFWAFTIGVAVNVPLGFVLSTMVFVDYWAAL